MNLAINLLQTELVCFFSLVISKYCLLVLLQVNSPSLMRPGSVEQYKRAFARQRARDLAQHADALLSKDKEIAALQQECRDLEARLGTNKVVIMTQVLSNWFTHLCRHSAAVMNLDSFLTERWVKFRPLLFLMNLWLSSIFHLFTLLCHITISLPPAFFTPIMPHARSLLDNTGTTHPNPLLSPYYKGCVTADV